MWDFVSFSKSCPILIKLETLKLGVAIIPQLSLKPYTLIAGVPKFSQHLQFEKKSYCWESFAKTHFEFLRGVFILAHLNTSREACTGLVLKNFELNAKQAVGQSRCWPGGYHRHILAISEKKLTWNTQASTLSPTPIHSTPPLDSFTCKGTLPHLSPHVMQRLGEGQSSQSRGLDHPLLDLHSSSFSFGWSWDH